MRRALVALLAVGVLGLGTACLDLSGRTHNGVAPGAEAITVRTADNRPLDARLWMRDPTRLVIYLHEYQRTQRDWWDEAITVRTADNRPLDARLWRRDPSRLVLYLHEYRRSQRDWWEEAERGQPTDPSTMTLDLRGHGDSGGDHLDFNLMAGDVRMVIADARSRGYQRIALVGAGLGGTVGVLVAREEPAVTVVGLSIPADFGGLDALDAAPAISGRLAIVASQDDLSARESLERIARTAPLDGARALLLPGRAHGRAVLTADAEGPARRLMRETFDRAWRQ